MGCLGRTKQRIALDNVMFGITLERNFTPEDMALPGYKFHELKGERKGTYAVSVSGNWRLTFRFEESNAVDVDMEDYH